MFVALPLVYSILALPSSTLAAGAAHDGSFDYESLSLREVGARNTIDWRIWLEKDGHPISPWHDVPLYPFANNDSIANLWVEIPRWTNGKVETSRKEPLNPIFHDDKKKKPRFVASVWPHRTYPVNYGSLCQSWENSNVKHPFTGYVGDKDPMDAFDISAVEPAYPGQIKQVKVLGGLAMIDDDTTDWKVITIDIQDPLAHYVDSVDDLDKYRPGLKESMYDWFTYYKVVKGKGKNTIIGNKFQNATFMRENLAQSHQHWKDLMSGKEKPGKISLRQTSNTEWRDSYIDSKDATAEFKIPPESKVEPEAPIPDEYNHWYYLDKEFNLITVPGQIIDID